MIPFKFIHILFDQWQYEMFAIDIFKVFYECIEVVDLDTPKFNAPKLVILKELIVLSFKGI